MIKLSDIAKSINEKHMWLKHELWEMWRKMKDDEILERIYRLEKLIKEQQKIATDTNVGCKWIPCSERLPNDIAIHEVTAQFSNGTIYTEFAYYDESREEWWKFDDDGMVNVIAWKEHSEPYKKEVNQ